MRSFSKSFKAIIPKISVLIYSGQDDVNVNTYGAWEWILELPNDYFVNK